MFSDTDKWEGDTGLKLKLDLRKIGIIWINILSIHYWKEKYQKESGSSNKKRGERG